MYWLTFHWKLFPMFHLIISLMAPIHYPNHCWLIISEVLWYSPEGNIMLTLSMVDIRPNQSFKNTGTSFRDQWGVYFTICLLVPCCLKLYTYRYKQLIVDSLALTSHYWNEWRLSSTNSFMFLPCVFTLNTSNYWHYIASNLDVLTLFALWDVRAE